MDVNVDEDSLIPNSSQSVLFNALKNTRVSFVLLLVIVIGIYIGMFFILDGNQSGNSFGSSSNMYIILLEIVLWVMLIVIVYVNIKHYDTENYNFRANLKNLFNLKLNELSVETESKNNKETTKPEVRIEKEIVEVCSKGNDTGKEVFHFPDNIHTYEEAKELCETHDARLATFDQIERAFNKGANWCSYGWSDEQMALFPTQKNVYNDLKKTPGHEHDCGIPGINGGYFENAQLKFGVNCYGKKPSANDKDKKYMHSLNHTPPAAETIKDLKPDDPPPPERKLIAPFNIDKWTSV